MTFWIKLSNMQLLMIRILNPGLEYHFGKKYKQLLIDRTKAF
jgi:hypothetical protein